MMEKQKTEAHEYAAGQPTTYSFGADPEFKLHNSQKWTVEVTVEVAEMWVEDGYEFTPEEVVEILSQHSVLRYYDCNREMRVTATAKSIPPKATIRRVQGYKDEEQR